MNVLKWIVVIFPVITDVLQYVDELNKNERTNT